jgi:hypothetical protein
MLLVSLLSAGQGRPTTAARKYFYTDRNLKYPQIEQ